MPPILLHLLSAALYAALAVYFWRCRWQDASTSSDGTRIGDKVALAIVLGIQGLGLYGEMFSGAGMRFGFALALSLVLWLALVFYWVQSWFARLDGLQMLVLPVAAACAALPAVFPEQRELVRAGLPLFQAHFLVAMLAYGLFALAALHAMLMAVAERRLHRGRLSRAFANLPPLLTMETLLFRLIWIAFSLLTLTVGSGIVFSEELFGRPLQFDHKTIFALASWIIFAGLLAGRAAYGWRGRTALKWTIAGFATLLLAYVGSRFVLEVILGRA
ncbi:MAG TPA: cytochrome C biogenesis protein [Rhodocyclaceae bacterium]|nr:MAG: cytochrome C biogenesis protein [Rhodocyclales bacterium CG17_big_fil_post_rev_8_21_14_2_50_68_7]HCX33947.1 cytochrome C biogenesis protein [Rhodocyclaceae bacterium]